MFHSKGRPRTLLRRRSKARRSESRSEVTAARKRKKTKREHFFIFSLVVQCLEREGERQMVEMKERFFIKEFELFH